MTSRLALQIELAKRSVRLNKRVAPYLYPQYSELVAARAAFIAARARLKAAETAWEKLGA